MGIEGQKFDSLKKKGGENLAYEQGELESGKLHWDNLHDEDEDPAGNKVDEATGLTIDNSTDDGLGGLSEVSDMGIFVPDEQGGDEAAKWLAAHDPESEDV